MAQRSIREYDAKRLIANYLKTHPEINLKYSPQMALLTPEKTIDQLVEENSWMKKERLVVKPDQLFGKRGKMGLILVDASFDEAVKWIKSKKGKTITIGKATGKLTHFLIEPFVRHRREYYLSFTGHPEGDYLHFATCGGVDIEDNWDKVVTLNIPIFKKIEKVNFSPIMNLVPLNEKNVLKEILISLFIIYRDLHFSFLEFNPFTFKKGRFYPLDAVARLDDYAHFVCEEYWQDIEFPPPFGQKLSKEELYIKELDEKSGASLKLKILNPHGRIWTMIAGGGASVIYADTIVDLGYGEELANYGEYSGNPSTYETFEYAKTILSLMTRDRNKSGKVLLIGGGIANFTDIAKTFDGIIMALEKFAKKIKDYNIKIFVRRGGPNYIEGLKKIREAGKRLNIPIEVYGPELHMTKIVPMAIKYLEEGVKNEKA